MYLANECRKQFFPGKALLRLPLQQLWHDLDSTPDPPRAELYTSPGA